MPQTCTWQWKRLNSRLFDTCFRFQFIKKWFYADYSIIIIAVHYEQHLLISILSAEKHKNAFWCRVMMGDEVDDVNYAQNYDFSSTKS